MTQSLRREPTFIDLFVWALERFPDRVAFVEGENVMTYAQARARISQLARALETRGFGPNTGLMTLSGNRADALLAGMASRCLGGWSGALHPLGSAEDHAYILEDSEALALVYDPESYEDRAREIAELHPNLEHLLSLGPSAFGDDVLASADAMSTDAVTPIAEATDVCSMTYTGGTTGRPKGIVQRHHTVVTMTQLISTCWQLPADIQFLAVTPISHAASCFVLPTLMSGGTVVLHKGFSPDTFYDIVERHRITLTFAVPTMIYALLDHPRTETADVSSLETIVYGAAPMSPTRLDEALKVFGPIFVQLYGQSEAPATVTALRKEEHSSARPHLLGSCGRALPGVEVKLLDDADEEVPTGEVGEICVRGAIVADGYWKLPDLTAETLRGGWLHTGDLARQDDEGYIYIVDRKKDMIISGGFNVFPREVEDALAEHPDVAVAAVIGVPDDKWGEAVTAIVVPRPGRQLDPDELIALVRERKGPIYAPKSVEIADAIPLTPLGKADRKAIRSRYWADRDRLV
jgi:fatty-acyl-CoA synthase